MCHFKDGPFIPNIDRKIFTHFLHLFFIFLNVLIKFLNCFFFFTSFWYPWGKYDNRNMTTRSDLKTYIRFLLKLSVKEQFQTDRAIQWRSIFSCFLYWSYSTNLFNESLKASTFFFCKAITFEQFAWAFCHCAISSLYSTNLVCLRK